MIDKKSPHRFTIKFNFNIKEQKMASDLLNSRPDKASYLATALLFYEQSRAEISKTPTLADMYAELLEIKQILLGKSSPADDAARSDPAGTIDKTSVSTSTELDEGSKDLLKNMFSAFANERGSTNESS